MSRPFASRYRGKCADCGEWWPEGELIRYDDDDQLVHATCDQPGANQAARFVACPACWLVHPEGACDR